VISAPMNKSGPGRAAAAALAGLRAAAARVASVTFTGCGRRSRKSRIGTNVAMVGLVGASPAQNRRDNMKRFSLIGTGFVVAMCAGASGAQAQQAAGISQGDQANGRSARAHVVTPTGASVALGGGVSNFFRETVRDMTGPSGSWDARISVGSRSYIGAEMAYVGGARSITAAGLGADASLINNGGEAAVRLNMPFEVSEFLLEPFAVAGIGWSHYNLHNANNTSSNIADSDNVGTVPLGLGLAFGYRGFIADARATYRPTFNDSQLVKASNGAKTDLQSWAVGATAGYEF
jgi:hypothetical protein